MERSGNCVAIVNKMLPEDQLGKLQVSLKRDRPVGDLKWLVRTVNRLGLQSSIRPSRRPKKEM